MPEQENPFAAPGGPPSPSPQVETPVDAAPPAPETPPQDEPVVAAAPVEGGTEGGEPEGQTEEVVDPDAFTYEGNVGEVLDHERIAPLLEERVRRASEEARAEGTKAAIDKLRPFEQRRQADQQKIRENLTTIAKRFNEVFESGGISADDLREVAEQNPQMLSLLSDAQVQSGKAVGLDWMVKAVLKENASEFSERVDQMYRGLDDPSFIDDFAEAIASKAVKPLKEENAELKAKVKRLESEARDPTKNGKVPPAAPVGRGGQRRPDAELLLDPTTPIETIQEIRARQRGG